MKGKGSGDRKTDRAKALAGATKLGVPQEHLAELAKAFGTETEQEGDDEFELWPGTEPAVNAFLLVTGQWRIASSMAGIAYVGLDYGAARGVWRDHGIKLTPEFWSDLRILEEEARNLLNGGE